MSHALQPRGCEIETVSGVQAVDVQECGIFHVFFNAVLVGCGGGGRSAVIIAEADFHSAAAAALLPGYGWCE